MIRIDTVRALASLERVEAIFRGLRDRALGTATITIKPNPDERGEGTPSNSQVLAYLARKHPALTAVRGAEMDRAVRAAVRARFDWRTFSVPDMARIAGPVVARLIAERLKSGTVVTNTPETTERKARRGLSTTPGVETQQLADALENADIEVD